MPIVLVDLLPAHLQGSHAAILLHDAAADSNRGFCNPNPRWQGNPTGRSATHNPQAIGLL